MFPTIQRFDDRLPNKTEVIGVAYKDNYKAYSLDYLSSAGVVNDSLGDLSIVLVSDTKADLVDIFQREHGGQTLTFEPDPENANLKLRDQETGSLWDSTGRAVSGPAQGSNLKTYPHYSHILWYIWANFHPQTELWA